MARHAKPDDGSNGAHAENQDPGFEHKLPVWFARRGPRPYWLAEHWSMILAATTSILVLLNTVLTFPGINVTAEKWINAGIAWVAALALYLKDQQGTIHRVAAWRERNRDAPKE